MPTPLGEEFIKIRPDATTFRAELQAQIAAAMTGVQAQMGRAQAQLAAVTRATPSGIVIPPGVKSVSAQATVAANAQAAAIRKVGGASTATRAQLAALSSAQIKNTAVTRGMQRNIAQAETAVGRYSRGMVAATAASTGFFRAVSFASGAFLIGAAVGAAIGSAVKEFSQMTQVGQTTARLIKATGGAANVTAQQVNTLATSTMALSGVDDELIKQGANVLLTFRNIRNETGATNDIFNRATKAAVDISTVFRTDVRGSALQLGKALQDPVRGVTALRRSGISLSVAQRDLIKRLVESGATLTAQKVILNEVERQVGGTAEAVGKTLPGRLRIMREEAKNALGDYVKRLTESKTAAELASGAAKGLAQTFGAVHATVQTLGPPLIGVARGLARMTQAVGGAGTLLGLAVAYKAVTIAAGLYTTAMRLMAAASAGAAQATLLQAQAAGTATLQLEGAAAAELTAARSAQRTMTAMVALNAVFAIGAAASGQWQIAMLAGGLAIAGMATKALAAVRALRAAGTAVTGLRVAMAALGGPIGIAAIAVAALSVGFYKLWQRSKNAAGSVNATRKALEGLASAIKQTQAVQAGVAGARENVGIARLNRAAAARVTAQAQNALATTTATPGSLTYLHLQHALTEAQTAEAKAANRLTNAEIALARARDAQQQTLANRPHVIRRYTDALDANVAAIRRSGQAQGRIPSTDQRRTELQTKALERYRALIDRFARSSDPRLAKVARALQAIFTSTGKLPTEKQLRVVVSMSLRGGTNKQIFERLLGISPSPIELTRFVNVRNILEQGTVTQQQEEQFRIAKGQLKIEQQKFNKIHEEAVARRENLRTARLELAAAQDAVASARESRQTAIEGLADAQRGLADAHQNLTDTIARAHASIAEAISSSRQALNDSIQEAKGNLQDLGQAIAEAIGKFTEAGGQASSSLSDRFRILRENIIRGGGGPETLKAAQEVNFAIQGKAQVDTEKITQQFNDLVDAFSRGQIQLPQFNRRFTNLLKGVNIDAFRKKFGSAAANTLLDQIRTFRRQAGVIAKSPERAGGAIAQKLINPLKVLAQGTKDIAAARRQAARDIAGAERDLADSNKAVLRARLDIVKADRQLAQAERRLRQAQHKETIANTKAISQNAKETKQLRIALQARRALVDPKVKPKGANAAATIPIEDRPR